MLKLIGTGGTITGQVGAGGTYSASLSASHLLDSIRPHFPDTEIASVEFTRKLSFEIGLDGWLNLVRKLQRLNEDTNVRGIVVVQGTALLEEVPFLSSLFLRLKKPLVFTGALVPLTLPGSDALGNLVDAIRVALKPESAEYGAMVVMGRRVVAARNVFKRHKSSLDAITALGAGPLGEVDSAGVRWLRPPEPWPIPPLESVRMSTAIPFLKVTLGSAEDLIDAALKDEPAGLLIEGFPGGGVYLRGSHDV